MTKDEICGLLRQIHDVLAMQSETNHWAKPTPAEYAMGYAEGFNDACKPKQGEPVGKLQEPTGERAWFTIAELNAWADKKLAENPHWVMPTEEPERKEALAKQEQDSTYIYASSLAKTIWQKHYMKESPKFALLDTTAGVLTQIDNMTCGLVREKPAQQEQEQGEPVCPECKAGVLYECVACSSNNYPPQRTWVGLTDEEASSCQAPSTIETWKRIEAKLKEKNT
jgi:hypothetical protein